MGDVQVHGEAGEDVHVRDVGSHDEEVEGGDASLHDEEEGVHGDVAELHDEVAEVHDEVVDDELHGEEEDDVQEVREKVYA